MSSITWTPPEVWSEARPWRARSWRVVEAQHVASTMKLVDTAAEQDVLEALLERAKPAGPTEAAGLDYLLATPFRYPPRGGGSRFRAAHDPGVYYGGETVRTSCAELGYWRWRFLRDAVDLEHLDPVAHTVFRVEMAAHAVDLRRPPFDAHGADWRQPDDYAATQAFARTAREAGVGAVVYASVRDPDGGWCVALLTPGGFASRKPDPARQTWWLAVRRDAVSWRRDTESMVFSMRGWAG